MAAAALGVFVGEIRLAQRAVVALSAPLYSVRCMMTADQGRACSPHEVGARLRALRVQAGLTQETLAGRLGTTQSAIARMERGRKRTSLELIGRVAEALGCDVALLIEQRRTA